MVRLWDNAILPSAADPNLSCLSICCIAVNRSASCASCMLNVNHMIGSHALFRSFHPLSGIPSHHLKHAHSPGEVRPFMHRTVCLGVFLKACDSVDSDSRRRSAASLSTSFSRDSLCTWLERFYHNLFRGSPRKYRTHPRETSYENISWIRKYTQGYV